MRFSSSLLALMTGFLLMNTAAAAESRLIVSTSSAALDGWIGTSLTDGQCLPTLIEKEGPLRIGNPEAAACGARRAFLSFNLQSLTGRQVVRAELYLYQTELQGTLPETAPGIIMDLLDFGSGLEADDWDRPAEVSSVAALSISQEQAEHRLDVTQLLNFQIASGKSRFQFRLAPEEAVAGEILFPSGDSASALAPRLEITLADPVVVPVAVRPPDPRFGPPSPEVGTYVGLALVNTAKVPNRISQIQRTAQGLETARQERLLSPNGQEAKIIAQASEALSLTAAGNAGAVQGFFMMGNFDLRRLDGVGAGLAAAKRLFFPVGNGEDTRRLFFFDSMPGGDRPLDLRLISETGELIEERRLTLTGEGSIAGDLDQIFPTAEDISGGYVEAISNRAFRAFQLIESPRAFALLAGLDPVPATRLVAPHFFAAKSGGSVLTLLNFGDSATEMRIEVRDDLSELLAERTVQLRAGEISSIDLVTLLGLSPEQLSDASPLTGFLQVEATSPEEGSVTGFIDFFGAGGAYRSMLPLISQGERVARLLHFAQQPASRIFTGLALLNLEEESSSVQIRLFDRSGGTLGLKELTLPAGSRVVSILDEEFFEGSTTRDLERGAHVEISSSEPVFLFALFGDLDLRYLAAIQSQRPLSAFPYLDLETACGDQSPSVVRMLPDPRSALPVFTAGEEARLAITFWDNSEIPTSLGGFQRGISGVEWDTSQLEALGAVPRSTIRVGDSPFSAVSSLTFTVPEELNSTTEISVIARDVEQCATRLRIHLQLQPE